MKPSTTESQKTPKHISASIFNAGNQNEVKLATGVSSKVLNIPAKTEGKGSSVNGGELLFLALATCVCNDIYREAAKRKIEVISVKVDVTGEFGGEGEPGFNIQYHAKLEAKASAEEVSNLIAHVDKVAEIHKTVRIGTSVTLLQGDLPTE